LGEGNGCGEAKKNTKKRMVVLLVVATEIAMFLCTTRHGKSVAVSTTFEPRLKTRNYDVDKKIFSQN